MELDHQKSSSVRSNASRPGLRERKKNKTRKIIQREALRLFRLQGYEATTISQIAEAAEISESTFFRYFPTKEDIVRWDEFDPLILESFRAQPAGLTTIAALRGAFHEVLNRLSRDERAELNERIALALAIPHALGAEQLKGPTRLLVEAIAQRAQRSSDEYVVQVCAGAILGAGIAAVFTAAENPAVDIVNLLDEALAHLETGFSI